MGDLVLRRHEALGKLEARAEGPYHVIAVGGSFLQRITIQPEAVLVGPRRNGTRRGTLTVHASQLTPFREPAVAGVDLESEGDPPSMVEGEHEHLKGSARGAAGAPSLAEGSKRRRHR